MLISPSDITALKPRRLADPAEKLLLKMIIILLDSLVTITLGLSLPQNLQLNKLLKIYAPSDFLEQLELNIVTLISVRIERDPDYISECRPAPRACWRNYAGCN